MDIKTDDNFVRNDCDTTRNDDDNHIQFPQSHLVASAKHCGRSIHARENSHSKDIASSGNSDVSASSACTSVLNDLVRNEENHDHLMKKDYDQNISPAKTLTTSQHSSNVLYNTVAYEEATPGYSRDASSMVDVQGASTKTHISASENSMPEQIKEDIACSTAAVQVAHPLGTDNIAGIVEDEPSCCSDSNEVTSMTVTQELVSEGTDNYSGNGTHVIGISTHTGMLTETSVINDQSANTSDRRGPSNSRCTTNVLELGISAKMDAADVVPETVKSTKTLCDEDSDPILQLSICYEDQGGAVNKQVASDVSVEEPYIQPIHESQPSVHSTQQSVNGVVTDAISIYQCGYGDLLKNDGVQTEPVRVNSLRAEEMCITAQYSDCRPFCEQTLLTKEEQAPVSQESEFYLTHLAVAPHNESLQMELELNGKSDTVSVEVFEADSHTEVNVDISCIHPECKLEERPMNRDNMSNVHQQSVAGLDNSSIEIEVKKEEKQRTNLEICNIDHQSVVDLEIPCVDCEGKLKHRKTKQLEVLKPGDQQFVIRMDISSTESVGILEEGTINKMDQQSVPDMGTACIEPEHNLKERPIDKPEVFEMDHQSVPDVETACIEPEDKLKERPIDKPEVFEMDHQSVPDVGTTCIEPGDNLKERPIDKPEVFEMDHQSVPNVRTACIEPEDKLKERPIDKPEVFEMDHQSVPDVGTACIEAEDKLKERPIDKPEVFEMDHQSVPDVGTTCIEPGYNLKERPIDKPEVLEMDHQSVPDVGTACIEPEDKLKERPTDKPEVFEMDHQSVPDVGTACIEPEDKLEERPIYKPEVFEMDHQSVPDVGTACIEPEDKLEKRPIDKPEVFEMDHQSVPDVGTACIEPEDKLEKRPIDKPEVFEMDQQSVPDLGTVCIEPEDKLEERPIDKPEVFEMDRQSVPDVGTACIEPEDKLEERPIDKPEVFEMDHQSVPDVGTACIEPEDKLEERPIDKPEVFEMDHQSVPDVGTACIEPEDKLEKRPIDKPEVFEMHEQSMPDLGIFCIQSENKFHKSQMHSIASYSMDQQLVPHLEMCCIEPEGKCEQKPINKTEVLEINQQLVPNLDISGIEFEGKLEETSVETTEEVYDLDQLFVTDQVIPSFGSDGNVERRPVNKPEVYDVDRQSTVELNICCNASEGKIEERSVINKQTILFDQQLIGQMHSVEETNQRHLVKLDTDTLDKNMPDEGVGVSTPTLPKHSDRHERSAQEDQYTKIKSCFHTATMVQFASPLVSYIEYSNAESSCSSEDTQDAMEIVPYLHNDTTFNFTFDNTSWVFNDDVRNVEKDVSDSRSAVKGSASESNGNLKHRTYSDAVNNDTTFHFTFDNTSWVFNDDVRNVEKDVSDSRSAVKGSASESNGNPKHRTYSNAVNNNDAVVITHPGAECSARGTNLEIVTSLDGAHRSMYGTNLETGEIITGLDGALSSTYGTNFGIGVNVQDTSVTNEYSFYDCNCGTNDTFETILNNEQEGKESDQEEQRCTVAELQEGCLIMRHSQSIKEAVDDCMNELLEAVCMQIDASEMSIFRTEEDVSPDATNATNVCCDADLKDRNQQQKHNIPVENDASIIYEEMSMECIGHRAENDDRVKQIIAKRENGCTAASLNGDHNDQKDVHSDPESYIPSKLRKLSVGYREDTNSCHTVPATELQEIASHGNGLYSRWIKEEIRTDAEDQQVPKADAASLQEESLYRGRF